MNDKLTTNVQSGRRRPLFHSTEKKTKLKSAFVFVSSQKLLIDQKIVHIYCTASAIEHTKAVQLNRILSKLQFSSLLEKLNRTVEV